MLLPPDADLCRRDPDLPGLPLLLDPDALLDLLRRTLPEANLGVIRPTYLRYKPGLACLAAFEVDVDGRQVLLHAQAYAWDAREKYSKLSGPDEVPGPLGPGHVPLPQHGIVVSVFPNDRKLHAVRRLADPADFAKFVAKLDPAIDPAETSLDVLSYKPERRLVARLLTRGRAWAVLRVYTDEAFATAYANARAFRSTSRLRVARRLGKLYWQQMLAVEHLPGRSLDEHVCGGSDVAEVVTAVALAVADLHAQSDGRLRDTDPITAADRIAELARWVGFVCPELAEPADRLAEKLRAGLLASAPAADIGAMHGDFYASQVLLGGTAERVAVVDFDEAARGETVADVANFIAHLAADAIRGHVSPDRIALYAGGLTEAYRQATGRPVSSRLNLHLACGLFRLLPHPFRRRERGWSELARRILCRAEESLESA
jgi:hypothetical protein